MERNNKIEFLKYRMTRILSQDIQKTTKSFITMVILLIDGFIVDQEQWVIVEKGRGW